ncbi:MAG: HEAT repeat domain-containing protein, partial [Gemmatimonadales bacterium]
PPPPPPPPPPSPSPAGVGGGRRRPVTQTDFLIVVAGLQAAFLIALIGLIVVTRLFWMRRRARIAGPKAELEEAMRHWALGSNDPAPVLAQLRRLPPTVALDMLAHYVGRTPPELWRHLARAVAGQPWVTRIRRGARSRFWWRRLEAGRLLTLIGSSADVAVLLRLLGDPHPAVVIAVIGALERVQSPALDTAVLSHLPKLPRTVQAYASAALQRAKSGVVPVLATRLRGPRDASGLAAYVDLAGRLADPSLRDGVLALADHPNLEVRTAVARVLSRYPHDDSVRVLNRLAADPAWQTRAQAIQSLGRLGGSAVALFRTALRDSSWWVRLRAALALARAGGEGRNALLAAETGADAFARDMARFVLGLTPGALAEYQR